MTRTIASILCAVMLALVVPAKADAHTTYCDLREALKFDYGPKVRAVIWVPRQKGDAFRAGVEAFFDSVGYSVWGVNSGDLSDPSYRWNQIPQLTESGIAFSIRSRRDSDFATVEMTTFSFDCAATEDWRPHWRRFQDFLRASQFKSFLAWRPLFGEVYQTVSWGTPLWYIRLQAFICPFSYLFDVLLNPPETRP